MLKKKKSLNKCSLRIRRSLWDLRDDGVGGDDVLHLFGPGVHEAEPSAAQRDERAIFYLELVQVCVDLLPHLQYCTVERDTV